MAEPKEFHGGEFLDKLGNKMDAVLTEMQNSDNHLDEEVYSNILKNLGDAYQAVGMTEVAGLEVMMGRGTPPGEEGEHHG